MISQCIKETLICLVFGRKRILFCFVKSFLGWIILTGQSMYNPYFLSRGYCFWYKDILSNQIISYHLSWKCYPYSYFRLLSMLGFSNLCCELKVVSKAERNTWSTDNMTEFDVTAAAPATNNTTCRADHSLLKIQIGVF